MIRWDRQPLGAVSDYALAKRLGLHWASVGAQRKRRGIPPFQPAYFVDAPALRHVICDHLSHDPISVSKLHEEVLQDYGAITLRSVHRALNWLIAHRKVDRKSAGYIKIP